MAGIVWHKVKDQSRYQDLMKKLLSAPGPLSFPEAVKLFELASDARGDVLEIGTRAGRSSVALAHGLQPTNFSLTCIDPWYSSWAEPERDRREAVVEATDRHYEGTTEDCFRTNLAAEIGSGKVIVEKGECGQVLPRLFADGKRFDTIFLDAMHDYDSVKADIESIKPFKPRVLILHDYYVEDWHPGVKKAAIEHGLTDPTICVDTIGVFYSKW